MSLCLFLLQGVAGEKCAAEQRITRADQDAFARTSYERAQAALAAGHTAWELAPVSVPAFRAGGVPTLVDRDEEVGAAKFEKFATMSPAFDKANGTITAANASKLSDGASALLVVSGAYAKRMRLPVVGRVRAYADAERAPIDFAIAPAAAVPIALQRAGIANVGAVDAWEVRARE